MIVARGDTFHHLPKNMDTDVKVGDMVEIIVMKDEPQYTGKTGVITHIDGIGQLHGTWGGLALIPNVDSFEVIKGC